MFARALKHISRLTSVSDAGRLILIRMAARSIPRCALSHGAGSYLGVSLPRTWRRGANAPSLGPDCLIAIRWPVMRFIRLIVECEPAARVKMAYERGLIQRAWLRIFDPVSRSNGF
jgi:hypothetical protein